MLAALDRAGVGGFLPASLFSIPAGYKNSENQNK
jgi:hypothetical protein